MQLRRPIDAAAEAYIKLATKQTLFVMWVLFAVIFSLGSLVTLVAVHRVNVPLLGIVCTLLAVRTWRKRAARREALRYVISDGRELAAEITGVRASVRRYRFLTYYTYHLDFRVVRLSTPSDTASLLRAGTVERVLWSATFPDEIVPLVLLQACR
jgi:hypothetical protein